MRIAATSVGCAFRTAQDPLGHGEPVLAERRRGLDQRRIVHRGADVAGHRRRRRRRRRRPGSAGRPARARRRAGPGSGRGAPQGRDRLRAAAKGGQNQAMLELDGGGRRLGAGQRRQRPCAASSSPCAAPRRAEQPPRLGVSGGRLQDLAAPAPRPGRLAGQQPRGMRQGGGERGCRLWGGARHGSVRFQRPTRGGRPAGSNDQGPGAVNLARSGAGEGNESARAVLRPPGLGCFVRGSGCKPAGPDGSIAAGGWVRVTPIWRGRGGDLEANLSQLSQPHAVRQPHLLRASAPTTRPTASGTSSMSIVGHPALAEVIVVNDGSTDATEALLPQLPEHPGALPHPQPRQDLCAQPRHRRRPLRSPDAAGRRPGGRHAGRHRRAGRAGDARRGRRQHLAAQQQPVALPPARPGLRLRRAGRARPGCCASAVDGHAAPAALGRRGLHERDLHPQRLPHRGGATGRGCSTSANTRRSAAGAARWPRSR